MGSATSHSHYKGKIVSRKKHDCGSYLLKYFCFSLNACVYILGFLYTKQMTCGLCPLYLITSKAVKSTFGSRLNLYSMLLAFFAPSSNSVGNGDEINSFAFASRSLSSN